MDDHPHSDIPEAIKRTSAAQSQPKFKPRPRMKLKLFITTVFLATLGVLGASAWYKVWSSYLENTPPTLTLTHVVAGLGIEPVNLELTAEDHGSGLDEIIVRMQQRGVSKEIFKMKFQGEQTAKTIIPLEAEKNDLTEGPFNLEIRAFDRSFWSNATTQNVSLEVDFRRPKVEVLSAQHNARRGGSQLLFYRAQDQNLAFSGVLVNNQRFLGFPARSIDKDLNDPNLFVVIYALDMRQYAEAPQLRVFAEDRVGNISSATFNHKEFERKPRQLKINLFKDLVEQSVPELIEQNLTQLRNWEAQSGQSLVSSALTANSYSHAGERFQLVNHTLRKINNDQLTKITKESRPDAYWHSSWSIPNGAVNISFADEVSYFFNQQSLGKTLSLGNDFKRAASDSQVYAANDGIVVFVGTLGIYGQLIVIDHGLGLMSVYANLSEINIANGALVTRGQKIGNAGISGFATERQLHFEIRNQGIAVDPIQWWDEGWYQAHITEKINDLRLIYGLPVDDTL